MMTPEQIEEAMRDPDMKTFIQSQTDKRVTIAINSYRENHPTSDILPSRLDRIEAKLMEKDTELRKEQLGNYTFRKCSELGIPPILMDGYSATNKDQIDSRISVLAQVMGDKEKRDMTERVISSAFKPAPNLVDRYMDHIPESSGSNRLSW